ncbi:MAG: Hpt domain-containing protein [Spirochaetales bacterium]|nr:Hpt domain-containing protein [Spirochaetales bacterium]
MIDIETFSEEMDNDREVIKLILTELISSIDMQIPLMRKHLQNNEFTALSREAHSIKGGCRNVMSEPLALAAENLEKTALNEISNDTLIALKDLTTLFEQFKNFVNNNFI